MKAGGRNNCPHVYLENFRLLVVNYSIGKACLDALVAFGADAATEAAVCFGPDLLFG